MRIYYSKEPLMWDEKIKTFKHKRNEKAKKKSEKKGNQGGLTMERKIGEIFEHDGEWYQCMKDDMYDYCKGCASFENLRCTTLYGNRDCWLKVACKKLEKVGKPVEYNGGLYQGYKAIGTAINICKACVFNEISCDEVVVCDERVFYVAIKQNQEDMEEKKLNLKPFDLEKAKAGKPVCTRDGRKARIICFDRRLFYKNVSYPILAVVERSDGEDDVCGYNEKGKVLIEDGAEYKDDLMMLPEKKEGWVNVMKGTAGKVYVGNDIYRTEDEAKKKRFTLYF